MRIFKKDNVGIIIIKALKKDGAYFVAEFGKEKIKEEIYLKGKRYGKGSCLFSFKFSSPLDKSSKLTFNNLSECFSDISHTRKEFKNNLIIDREKNYCQIWIDSDEDSMRNVVEIVLNLKYNLENWEITNINK